MHLEQSGLGLGLSRDDARGGISSGALERQVREVFRR